jgi:hypothetical protein
MLFFLKSSRSRDLSFLTMAEGKSAMKLEERSRSFSL